ncbi:hypothetical protein INT46_005768 [Mucor plumbeus]|uniref:Uncharacterized protein n=1 Tax=Mucor plumbeus TaxID=97098 RepID=A0A8H7QNX4_9FUNG|nr:hypothetical protein INT46_005768 [Mucor plumbeus]
MTTAQEATINTQNTTEDLATYQTRVDDVSTNMNKKLEEMTKRIDSLERSLKQMEVSPANLNSQEADLK